jgi:hypothetical protein
MGSTLLCEMFDDTSHQHIRWALPAQMPVISEWSQRCHANNLPRSGYRGSDLVPWHHAEVFGAATILSGFRGISATPARWQACVLVTHIRHRPGMYSITLSVMDRRLVGTARRGRQL